MIRVVALVALAALGWQVLRWAVAVARRSDVDWRGVAFAVGFVMLAAWLNHATGFGQLFG